jgi:BNR/Asp-box repeat.
MSIRLLALFCLFVPAVLAAGAEHRVVYHDPAEFAGWPANEGLWSWGDDEMLVAFEVAKFVETDGDHSVDRESPKRIVFARSLDGGETWTPEEHPEIAAPEYLGDAEKFVQKTATARDPRPSPGGFDFTHPNFAMKLRGGTFYVSHNRGRSWEGPYLLTEYDFIPEARTSYIVTGPSSATVFMTGRVTRDGLKYGRSCVLRTEDGGKTFRFLSWIGEDIADRLKPNERGKGFDNIFSIMPSAVRLGDDHFVCAVRQRTSRVKWTDIFESKDGGRSWEKIATLEKGSSNPATLVLMTDGTIAAVYGNRRKAPCGVAAKLSRDQGRTWSDEIVLRADARKWDIGYSRALQRPDGKIVALYYYTTEDMPQNFIAATIWDVASAR